MQNISRLFLAMALTVMCLLYPLAGQAQTVATTSSVTAMPPLIPVETFMRRG